MDKLEERMVLQEAGKGLFHGEEPIIVKDIDLTIVVLTQGTRRSCLSKERRGCKDVLWTCPTGTSYLSPFESFFLYRLIISESA